MFNKLHGVIRVKKEDLQQQQLQQPQQLQPVQPQQLQPVQQNILPVIIPPDLQNSQLNYIKDGYKFEQPKPIEYIPPEIIPKENPQQQYDKQQYDKPQYEKQQYDKPQYEKPKPQYNNKEQGKRFASFDAIKEAQKGNVFDKLAKTSLEKYKINQNNIENNININIKPKPKPKIEVIPKETEIKNKTLRKVSIKKEQEFVPKKNSADNKKYLSEIEAIKKSLARLKNIEKDKKPSKKLSKKNKYFEEPEKVIREIEKSDEIYKIKFDKLKYAYIKKHNTLIHIFNGYQNIYEKLNEISQDFICYNNPNPKKKSKKKTLK